MKRALVLGIVALALAGCGGKRAEHFGPSSGIEGTVLLGPLCPVERADSPCPDKPIAAEISVKAESGQGFADGRSDADGHYRIDLPPGVYTVTARGMGQSFQVGKAVSVTVLSGEFTHLDLMVDSGIR
jgi:hypothetical protein